MYIHIYIYKYMSMAMGFGQGCSLLEWFFNHMYNRTRSANRCNHNSKALEHSEDNVKVTKGYRDHPMIADIRRTTSRLHGLVDLFRFHDVALDGLLCLLCCWWFCCCPFCQNVYCPLVPFAVGHHFENHDATAGRTNNNFSTGPRLLCTQQTNLQRQQKYILNITDLHFVTMFIGVWKTAGKRCHCGRPKSNKHVTNSFLTWTASSFCPCGRPERKENVNKCIAATNNESFCAARHHNKNTLTF